MVNGANNNTSVTALARMAARKVLPSSTAVGAAARKIEMKVRGEDSAERRERKENKYEMEKVEKDAYDSEKAGWKIVKKYEDTQKATEKGAYRAAPTKEKVAMRATQAMTVAKQGYSIANKVGKVLEGTRGASDFRGRKGGSNAQLRLASQRVANASASEEVAYQREDYAREAFTTATTPEEKAAAKRDLASAKREVAAAKRERTREERDEKKLASFADKERATKIKNQSGQYRGSNPSTTMRISGSTPTPNVRNSSYGINQRNDLSGLNPRRDFSGFSSGGSKDLSGLAGRKDLSGLNPRRDFSGFNSKKDLSSLSGSKSMGSLNPTKKITKL